MIAKGYNPDYGARPLRRSIENYIEDPLSEEILRGTFKGMNSITVSVDPDGEKLAFKASAEVKEETKALAGVGGGTTPARDAKS